MVDHFQQYALESYADRQWKWTQIPIDENWMVSVMTKQFAEDILETGKCCLPTLKECYPEDQFILSALKPRFNELLKQQLDYCPVT